MSCTGLEIPYPHKHTLILGQINGKQVITNAYPMKLLKATQARGNGREDKESERETERERKMDGERRN